MNLMKVKHDKYKAYEDIEIATTQKQPKGLLEKGGVQQNASTEQGLKLLGLTLQLTGLTNTLTF